MTNYRLFPSSNGPPLVATSGDWLLGTIFSVTGGVNWFEGYWIWVPTGGDLTPRKCALWNRYSTSQEYVIAGTATIVTSGTLSATPTGGESGGHWNFVSLPTPVQLAPGALYVAAIGWVATNGIPVTSAQWGSGDPHSAGIVNGPLTGWSATSGSKTFPAATVNYGLGQQLFSNTSGTADPSVAMPNNGSGDDSLGVDVQISDTAPSGYMGSWRFWPNMADLGNYNLDTANGFTLGWEFTTQQANVNNVWFYSPPTVTVLPTKVGVFRVSDQSLVLEATSVTWTALGGGTLAAGGGWGYTPLSGFLPADTYKVAVFQPLNDIWNAAVAHYTDTGFGSNGLTAGPMTAPNNASATSPGQASYNTSTSDIAFPNLNAGPYSYGVDIELTAAQSFSGTGNAVIALAATGPGTAQRFGSSHAAIALTASASAGVAARTGTGAAVISLGTKILPPPPRTGVTGWDLYSTLVLQSEYRRYYDSLPPVACPFDGTPLRQGPSGDSNILYCPMGNFYYPDDWDPDTMSGM